MSVFICCGLIAWGRPFIIRWIGPAYLDGYKPLVVLALAVLVDVSQRSSADLLFATFNQKFYAWINGAEALVNLGFSLALARPYGILGVAMGTLIGAFTIRVVLQPWWVCKVSGLNYGAYMRFAASAFARCACLAALAVAVSWWGLKPNYLWLISSAVFDGGLRCWVMVRRFQPRRAPVVHRGPALGTRKRARRVGRRQRRGSAMRGKG